MRSIVIAFIALLVCTIADGQILNVAKFGAIADGKTLTTKQLQAAIDEGAKTGSTVWVPAGTYYTGTLMLRTNTHIELAPGAVLLGSTDIKDYVKLTWGHHEDRTPWHLIVAKNVNNVRISGQGAIDGNGMAFWKKDRKHEWAFYQEIEERPSPMIEIEGCKRVQVSGIHIRNSAGWGLHPFNSDDVKLHDLTITNSPFGPNSDGIDVTGCKNVIISNCHIDVGDDGIALKTTEDSGPCEYITITNCVISTNCVGLRIGFESRKDFRFITASNLIIKNSSRFIDVRSVEGAIIEHVVIDNIIGTTNCGWPINRVVEMEVDTANTPYSVEIPEHPNYRKNKPILKKGAIRDVTISHLSAVTDGRIMAAAAPGFEMKDIRFEHINLEYAMIDEPNPLAQKARTHGFFKNMQDVREARAAVVVKNITNLKVTDLNITWPKYPVSSDWNLLKTEWRKLNPSFYVGNEDAIRRGEKRSQFSAFWSRDLVNPSLELGNVTGSETGVPAVVK